MTTGVFSFVRACRFCIGLRTFTSVKDDAAGRRRFICAAPDARADWGGTVIFTMATKLQRYALTLAPTSSDRVLSSLLEP